MHTFRSYTDTSLAKYINAIREYRVRVFVQLVPDNAIVESAKIDMENVTTDVVQFDVMFSYNNYHQQEEAEVLASAELTALMTAASGDFFNAFGLRNGAPTTYCKVLCSQGLTKAMINNDLKGEIRTLSPTFQYTSAIPSFFWVTSPAYLTSAEELDWVKPYVNEDKMPASIFPTEYKNIFDRVAISNEGCKFLPSRKALEDFISLPHNIENGFIPRPFQSLLGAIGSKTLSVAQNDGMHQVTSKDGALHSTFVNHVSRMAIGTIRTVINREEIELVNLVKGHYSRAAFLKFKDKGLDFKEGERRMKALITEVRKDC
ncbi:hypothetical protein [Vibrio agarivorans]|uniref:Uncharacterized protein n=1 Tax=Vibrio agarivorans TaxID=153622 RepID=A0ABT7Y7D0_9VIBR|nr:hypothetical protein [Vibrio agarivorans]MDN2483959.1 hypothetical protein [Vibrio agarivorans]